MRTRVYVDGFSVYYACYKGPTKTRYAHLKWLNYRALFEKMFPEDEIDLIRVFTAIAPNPPNDPSQAMRHDTYRRALLTLPGVEVHLGRFQRTKREAQLAHPDTNGERPIHTVYVHQEKHTDVSLASHLLLDAFDDTFDRAVILTNDSDFLVPIELITTRMQREVIVVSPDITANKTLERAATSDRILDRGLLFSCQLPDIVIDAQGREVRKPEAWNIRDVESINDPQTE